MNGILYQGNRYVYVVEQNMASKFIMEPVEFVKLQRTTNKATGIRTYLTPDGKNYPSITTILAADKKKIAQINAWKARVGHAEAKKIVAKASARGTSLHTEIEEYILEGTQRRLPFSMFPYVRPTIDKYLGKIYAVEKGVYSHVLKAAGTFDCFAQWDGVNSLIDWKSSKKMKQESWIENYLLQASFYSMCIFELKKIQVKQVVILIGVDGEREPQLFVRPVKNYLNPVIAAIKEYHKEHLLIT
jgi:hypothetical protein